MLLGYYRGHQNVDIMTLHLKHRVAEQFEDTLVGFHDFALLLTTAVYDHDGCILGKHDIELILVLFKLIHSFNLVKLLLKVLTLIPVILNLLEVVSIEV